MKAKGEMALSENVKRAVYTDRPLVVMPAVVELGPAVLGRGGHLSPFGHPCVSVAGIHLNNLTIDSRLQMSGKMNDVGNGAKD
jgi:hypothetical protein